MSKYHKLVKQYQNQIQIIKDLRKQAKFYFDQADEITSTDEASISKAMALCEQGEVYDSQASELMMELAQDIEAEYYGVPFAKPREAGIAGFWRESGLA